MKTLFSIIILITVISCKAQKGSDKGWEDLLENNNLSKWHKYGKSNVSNAWGINDGVLHFTPGQKEGGDIVTNNEYENFHLKLDWKISKNGNSGIFFLVDEDLTKYKYAYFTGLEMQILDNDGHPDGKIFNHRAGDLYDLIPVKKETVKPVGEWNSVDIILKDAKLEFYLNGEKVVSTIIWDKNWDDIVAKSKFQSIPGFAQARKGRIGLQDHKDEVWFRNIMIKKL